MRQDICYEVKTLWREKTTPRQPNPGNPLSKNKASYKTLVLTQPYVVVIPLTLRCNPTRALPNQIFHLKGFLMDSFTLGPTPKIDFTQTLEHTLAMAWELADLQFSLNILSKHYAIRYRIHTIYKPGALYL
jgi:hypothetical protein